MGMISSKPDFFSKGCTTATFNLVLNSPPSSDMLTILVISLITFGSIDFRMSVGMSSSSQVLVFICLMIRDTSFSVSGENFLSCGTAYILQSPQTTFLFVRLCPGKYSAKLSANESLSL